MNTGEPAATQRPNARESGRLTGEMSAAKGQLQRRTGMWSDVEPRCCLWGGQATGAPGTGTSSGATDSAWRASEAAAAALS